jgi:hypothetical protein
MVYDGKATVRDAETGEVLISLEELGMSNDDDYIGALSRMFNTTKEKAGEIVYTMTTGNGSYIQLGTEGANFSEYDYKSALKYTLTDIGQKMVGGMNDAVFYTMTSADQMAYLGRQVIIGGAVSGLDRGEMAAGLRDLKGLHIYNTLDGLFKENYDFMNDELRDFLNLNEYGTNKYDINTAAKLFSGWWYNLGNTYHLDPDYTRLFDIPTSVNILDVFGVKDTSDFSFPYNISDIFTIPNPFSELNSIPNVFAIMKFTNDDGREAIFGKNANEQWDLITNGKYGGTYNYGHMFGFMPGTIHDKFDVDPYFKKYPK